MDEGQKPFARLVAFIKRSVTVGRVLCAITVVLIVALAVTNYATNCAANWPLVLSFLNVSLSWPAVALYLGALFLIQFRMPIAAAIERFRGGQWGSAKIYLSPQAVVKDTEDTKEQVIRDAAITLEGQRATTVAGAVGPRSSEVAQDELARCRGVLGVAARWIHFERSLNLIFGSQLAFLKALRARPAGFSRLEILGTFYAEHQKPAGSSSLPFDTWIEWLKTAAFIREAVPESGLLVLANDGEQFLSYLDAQYATGLPYRIG